MHQSEIIVLLFAVVAASVLIARKIQFPYPIVLVLVGLALSFVPHLPEVKLDPNIFFYFFLPPLLAAAFALPLVLGDGRPFPDRNYILFITFCVILTTLVFQGLTLPFAIRRLCLQGDGSTAEEERVARLDANKAATALLEQVINDDALRRIQRDLDLAEARLTG